MKCDSSPGRQQLACTGSVGAQMARARVGGKIDSFGAREKLPLETLQDKVAFGMGCAACLEYHCLLYSLHVVSEPLAVAV